MRKIAIMIATLTFQLNAAGESCKLSPNLVDDCYETRGKIFAANGNPTFRMWKVGTNRILGIMDPEDPITPKKLWPHLGFSVEIFGDFLVCPFTKDKPGHMQYVCIESASNIRVEDFRYNSNEPKVIYIE